MKIELDVEEAEIFATFGSQEDGKLEACILRWHHVLEAWYWRNAFAQDYRDEKRYPEMREWGLDDWIRFAHEMRGSHDYDDCGLAHDTAYRAVSEWRQTHEKGKSLREHAIDCLAGYACQPPGVTLRDHVGCYGSLMELQRIGFEELCEHAERLLQEKINRIKGAGR